MTQYTTTLVLLSIIILIINIYYFIEIFSKLDDGSWNDGYKNMTSSLIIFSSLTLFQSALLLLLNEGSLYATAGIIYFVGICIACCEYRDIKEYINYINYLDSPIQVIEKLEIDGNGIEKSKYYLKKGVLEVSDEHIFNGDFSYEQLCDLASKLKHSSGFISNGYIILVDDKGKYGLHYFEGNNTFSRSSWSKFDTFDEAERERKSYSKKEFVNVKKTF